MASLENMTADFKQDQQARANQQARKLQGRENPYFVFLSLPPYKVSPYPKHPSGRSIAEIIVFDAIRLVPVRKLPFTRLFGLSSVTTIL
jgi:hypothetical protein